MESPYNNKYYDGYSFSDFQSFDKSGNRYDISEESTDMSELSSTDDIDNNFETSDTDENDNLRPEEFGLRPDTKMKKIYCDKNELYEEIRKYQKEDNPTDKLGEMLIKIALHMSTMSRFWRYNHAIKQEIVEHAIYQMLLSVPKFNLKEKRKNPFGYLSMICYRDMLHSLKKHFKQDKINDKIKEVYVRKLADATPNDDRLIALRQLLEHNSEYSNFTKEDDVKRRKKKELNTNNVDTYAISRKDQKKYSKCNATR